MISAMDLWKIIAAIVEMVGDAKAWRLEIRKWAYDRGRNVPNGNFAAVAALERWVYEVDAPLVGRRRTALRMWAFDACMGAQPYDIPAILEHATVLYGWAVQAEEESEMGNEEHAVRQSINAGEAALIARIVHGFSVSMVAGTLLAGTKAPDNQEIEVAIELATKIVTDSGA